MVNRDIILAKIAHIQKSLERLKEKQTTPLKIFLEDRDIQDITLLNLQIAIQGCIDIAGHIVSDNNWGIPGSMGGLFDALYEKKAISGETTEIMRAMAGFRNLIVHEYARLDMPRVYDVFTNRLDDFNKFLKEIAVYVKL